MLIAPFGKTWTVPSLSRRTIVRRLIASTSPAGAVDGGDVADADLVLEDEEEAADDVADQRLRAESDAPGPAMPAPVSTGAMSMPNSRSTISAAMPTIKTVVDLADRGPERAGAFGALERVEGTAARHLVLESRDDQGRRPN